MVAWVFADLHTSRYYPGHLDFFGCLSHLPGVDGGDVTSFSRVSVSHFVEAMIMTTF